MTAINIITVAAITLFIYWAIGTIILLSIQENIKFALYWATGLVYPILWVLFTPIRWYRYKKGRRGK